VSFHGEEESGQEEEEVRKPAIVSVLRLHQWEGVISSMAKKKAAKKKKK
jgi:hypothetical protein